MRKRMGWLLTLTIIVVVCVVAYYHKTMNSDESTDTPSEQVVSEVDKVINKDLDSNYPYTVREVVQFFNRIQKCYYNESYTEEELVKLAYKATELFDDELKAENQFDEYYEDLKTEIDSYKSTNQKINRIILDSASEVIYSTVDEQKYASINCIYYLKSDDGTSKVEETYLLRKDSEGRWKILGWKEYEESEWEE